MSSSSLNVVPGIVEIPTKTKDQSAIRTGNALPQCTRCGLNCAECSHNMPHEGFNTIDEYTFDTLKLPNNCDSPEMKFNGLSSVTNSARNQHLESHETRTACLDENVCDNRGDPTKERNSFDPLNFTKGERPRLERIQVTLLNVLVKLMVKADSLKWCHHQV